MKNLSYKSTVTSIAVVASMLSVPTAVLAGTNNNNGSDNPGNKVTICHATGSATNPFVVISPNANGVINGHYDHQDGRDIIPAFTYKYHGQTKLFPGQNLSNGGQTILDNGCKIKGGQGGGSNDDGGGNGGGSSSTTSSSTSSGGQVLASETVSTDATGAVAAGFGGASAFTLSSLDRAW